MSRRRILNFSTGFMLLAGVASSQEIGIFFDPDIRACSAIVNPSRPVVLHILALLGNDVPELHGAQFKITGVPKTWTPQTAVWLPDASVTINLGNPLFTNNTFPEGGVVLAFSECHGDNDPEGDTSPVPLGRIVLAGAVTPDNVTLRVAPVTLSPTDPNCPFVNDCISPNLAMRCVQGGEFYINSTRDCIPNPRLTTADILRFAPVTVGDTVTAALVLTNTGNVPLQVSSITSSDSLVQVPSEVTFALQSGDSRSVQVFFHPRNVTTVLDTLVIVSNSLFEPVMHIPIEASVLALGAETQRLVGREGPAPLGEAYSLLVLPRPLVRVEKGSLLYRRHLRLPGDDGSFSQVPLLASAADSVKVLVGTIPGPEVTEAGLEYYVQVENSAIRTTDPPGAPDDSLFTQEVEVPNAVSAIAQSVAGRFPQSTDINVSLVLETGTIFRGGTLYYRLAGTAAYESTMVLPGPPIPVATIPAQALQARGVEFWASVQALSRVLIDPIGAPSAPPRTIPVSVERIVEQHLHPGQRYRLLSVPLDFSSGQSVLEDMLRDQSEFGSYDATQWRAYRYMPQLHKNLELSEARAAEFSLQPGRAFWIISRQPHRVDTAPLVGLSTPKGEWYPIVLESGWSAFGNPFDFPVRWSDVRFNASEVGKPVSFDPSLGKIGDYRNEPPALLEPFEGYFIQNHSDHADTLWIPAVEAPPSAVLAGRSPSRQPSAAWRVHISATSPQASDGSNVAGVDPAAANELDPLDQEKPPSPPGKWTRLAFANNSWRIWPGPYRVDMRAPTDAGHAWEIEVRTSQPGERVLIEAWTEGQLPENFVLRLLDLEQSASADFTDSQRSYSLLSGGSAKPYRLALVAGTEDYVARAHQALVQLPKRVILDQNVPNPFNPITRIRFGLPESGVVALELFDVRGRRILAPLTGQPFPAGYHSILWDGRDETGREVAAGTYFCRLVIDSHVLTRKMILVR